MKKPEKFSGFFVFSYEGGDSELFNYLDSYHRLEMCLNCVFFLIKI